MFLKLTSVNFCRHCEKLFAIEKKKKGGGLLKKATKETSEYM